MFKYIAMFIAFMPLLAQANDTSFGGAGVLPIPISNTDVAMLNEHIVINGKDIDEDNYRGSWHYNCTYTFKNLSSKPLTFRMGFPFPIYGSEDENIATPAGVTINKGGALVYNFITKIGDKTIQTTRTKIQPLPDAELEYTDAYLWQMSFAPNQTINITHDYTTGVTTNSIGQITVLYILRTGRLWQGQKIGHAQFEVNPNTPTKLCSEIDEQNFDFIKPIPAGMKIVDTGKLRRYIWDLPNFAAQEDLSLCIITGKSYVRYYKIYPLMNRGTGGPVDIDKLDATQKRLLLNSIYAMHGRRFNDPALQSYFDAQWWYQPNDAYTDALLTSEDKQAIALLTKGR